MSITNTLTKLAFLSFISICFTFAFEYPSLSKIYNRNQNIANNKKTNTLKLNKPKSAKNINIQSSKNMRGTMAVSEDGCIIKTLRFRNGINLKIKQGCR